MYPTTTFFKLSDQAKPEEMTLFKKIFLVSKRFNAVYHCLIAMIMVICYGYDYLDGCDKIKFYYVTFLMYCDTNSEKLSISYAT